MIKNVLITPRKVTTLMVATVAMLLFANLIGIYLQYVMGYNFTFIRTFYFNAEANIPSFYSSMAILFSAIIIFCIGNLRTEQEKRLGRFWKLLGYIFVFLSMDEFLSIHEQLTGISRRVVGEGTGGGYLHYAWVIPYLTISTIAFLYLFRCFMRLPQLFKIQLAMAGLIFLSGAVGMEMIGGRHEFEYGRSQDLQYALFSTLEELLEMTGIIIFVHVLLKYFVRQLPDQPIRVSIGFDVDQAMHKSPFFIARAGKYYNWVLTLVTSSRK